METLGGAEPRIVGRRELPSRMRWVASHGAALGLLLVLAVWLGISLWAAPVQADVASLKAAADDRQVVDLDRLSSPPSPLSRQPLFMFGREDSTDNTGPVLVWTTRNGHRYYTDASAVSGTFPNGGDTVNSSLLSGDGSSPSPVDRVTAYVLERTRFQGGIAWAGLAHLALLVFAIGAIRGRAPRHGTRWFWFWVISLPLGAGVVWFALAERLRDRDPVRPRWNGGQGFAISLVGAGVIQLAVVGGQLLFTRL